MTTTKPVLHHVYKCGELTVSVSAETVKSTFDVVVSDADGNVVFRGNMGKLMPLWSAREALTFCNAEKHGAVKDRAGWHLVAVTQ